MRRALAVCAMAVLLAPGSAQASDFGGMVSGLLTFTLALPLTALSVLMVVVLGAAGAYRSRHVTLWHAGLASIPPLIGGAASLIASPGTDDAWLRLAANGGMLVLAQLPLLVHARQSRT